MDKIKIFGMILFLVMFGLFVPYTQADTSIKNVAGTIRNLGSGWYVLQDRGHTSINITGVDVDDEKIILRHEIGANRVISFSVTPDETMVKEGYAVGISGGINYSWIYIYDKSGQLVKPVDYVNRSGNIWIYGLLQ